MMYNNNLEYPNMYNNLEYSQIFYKHNNLGYSKMFYLYNNHLEYPKMSYNNGEYSPMLYDILEYFKMSYNNRGYTNMFSTAWNIPIYFE